ncbi:hypothetical protein NMR54_003614 [Vibrio cholerae]|nr:hypothetical protein [Vibrio cholerae]EGQ9334129.1 hypothetical protein [Vibrio cholerae]EIA3093231.1 hypothetical protein [Vibrio cholerae]EJL6322139.1 hypothetical protein [Vibrio cholerae]EJL7023809.1 hypothetical protein [Vibrio cholerae]
MSTSQPNASISPGNLLAEYAVATDNLLLSQKYSAMIQQQAYVNITADIGLATKVKLLQNTLKQKARDLDSRVIPRYLTSLSMLDNFCILVDSFYKTSNPLFSSASSNNEMKEKIAALSLALSDESSEVNIKISGLAQVVSLSVRELLSVSEELDSTLELSIKSLGKEVELLSSQIESLRKNIRDSIQAIVDGSDKVGSGIKEIIVGTITSIDIDKQNKDKQLKVKKNDKETGDAVPTPISTDFAVSSINSARDGAAETSEARANLHKYNEELAKAYRKLAAASISTMLAKVIQTQNKLFCDSLQKLDTSIKQVANIWGEQFFNGESSGITQGYINYASAVRQITDQPVALSLQSQLRNATLRWKEVREELIYQREVLVK